MRFPTFITGFLICLGMQQIAVANSLELALYILDGEHRHAIVQESERFRKLHPEYDLNLRLYYGDPYSDKVDQWLSEGNGPDVFYWHGGRQINYYSDRGLLKDLSAFWKRESLDERFSPASKSAVKDGGRVYGIPVTVQLWGFYYRISTLEKYGIQAPQHWSQLIDACKAATDKGISLFAFGSKTAWMTHGWFDYLNLRVNGIEYYRDLLEGNVSYLDAGVIKVLNLWRELLDNQCFNFNFADFDIDSAFPLLFHERAAMMLSFSRLRVPEALVGDFGFLPFPQIDPAIPQYTVSPVEVFAVPSYSKWRPGLEALLKFVSTPEFQRAFNGESRLVPVTKPHYGSTNKLKKMQAQILDSAPDGIQYFDRDTSLAFARHTPEVFVDFMVNKNVLDCATRLESLRKQVFVKGSPRSKRASKALVKK